MEEIYTVHVKCRPDPAQSYPSERAYSSSTVGGLATIHVIIVFLVTTLTTASYYSRTTWIGEFISGICLICGALLCALTGFLASRRWYIDRNIKWFFVASILSTICSVIALSIISYILIRPVLFHQSFIFFHLTNLNGNQSEVLTNLNNTQDNFYLNKSNMENYDSNTFKMVKTTSDLELLSPAIVHRFKRDKGDVNIVLDEHDEEEREEEERFQFEIYVHMLLASLAEIIISMFSIKIAWKGVKNSYENSCHSTNSTIRTKNGKRIRPDILENHKNGYCDPKLPHYSNVVKELYKLQKSSMISENVVNGVESKLSSTNIDPTQGKFRLPLPESQKEYRERIEKFLASHENCLKEQQSLAK